MTELVALRNITPDPQPVFWRNRQVIVPAYAEEYFDPELAEYILEMRAPFVERAEISTDTVLVRDEAPASMWVANMTGNPDAPKTYPLRPRTNLRTGLTVAGGEIDNPKYNPHTIVRIMPGGEIFYQDANGFLASRVEGPTPYTIPPFKRVELPTPVAKWFVGRDRMSTPEVQGTCDYSRRPSAFEPDSRWPLNEMRAYLQLCDYRFTIAQLGPLEEELVELHGRGNRAFDIAVKTAKQLCFKRLFFKLCDRNVVLPTRDQFESVYRDSTAEPAKNAMKASAALNKAQEVLVKKV